ncbi:MAG: hypothetical protein ABH848_02790 [Candidatus Omnitrophota bacterium]
MIKIIKGHILLILLLFFIGSGALTLKEAYAADPITFKIIAINPSKTERKFATIKEYLPQEVTPRYIIDTAGLAVEYDSKRSIYFLYKKNVELLPNEIKVFEIAVEDVWRVSEKDMNGFKERVDNILRHLEGSKYYLKAQEISDEIFLGLNDILRTQSDETLSRDRHIGAYRDNEKILDVVKEKIRELEKILVTAGGPAAPEMLEDTKVISDSPSKNMTWIVIFVIIIFLGLLAAVLFFTWQYQARLTKDALLDSRKSAFSGQEEQEE